MCPESRASVGDLTDSRQNEKAPRGGADTRPLASVYRSSIGAPQYLSSLSEVAPIENKCQGVFRPGNRAVPSRWYSLRSTVVWLPRTGANGSGAPARVCRV